MDRDPDHRARVEMPKGFRMGGNRAHGQRDFGHNQLYTERESSDLITLGLILAVVFGVSAMGLKWIFGVHDFPPNVLLPSFLLGVTVTGIYVARSARRKAERARAVRAERQVMLDAERQKQLQALKRERSEKGL